jgi:leucyl-tRNA synthetase
MEYKFSEIEKKWQDHWKENKVYKVSNESTKPKYYVLDMFPYPSGAGLHVGHPLGYIASDIFSRYKRLKGFNVLHPMGFDSFGLPAEQYALETGQHPAHTTEKNIATFKSQLDKIGFCYDWEREVRTSDPSFYKWTQWIFLQLFHSYFCNTEKKALPIALLIKKYETKGALPKSGNPIPGTHFTADEWNSFSKKQQEDILMKRRLAFCAYGEVNWCEALGTVLANDEVVNGVSERGGHPVEKKKMRQWYLRITSYADRLLQGLETVEFSDSMKDMQRNWIGKSEGAEMEFKIKPPLTPPEGEDLSAFVQSRETAGLSTYGLLKELGKEQKQNPTEEENSLWQRLRAHQAGYHIRRQHFIDQYIVDFVCLDKRVTIEVDGGYHGTEEQKEYDKQRTEFLTGLGFEEIRFTNEEVRNNIDSVVEKIVQKLNSKPSVGKVSPTGGDLEGASLKVYTTRPDTIFGVDFMVLAPEHELVASITSAQQKEAIEKYLHYVKSRSDRERQAEVKQITGCFTGAYAINPFDGKEIPIWIAEYVLAGYGTGAIMAVPCGDERDFAFAKHFNIPISNIIGKHFNGKEANATKDAILENSGFLNGLVMKEAMGVALNKIEELGIGKRKVNYRMRDAGFSRQRYWGEPFPIIWTDGIALPLDAEELPLELPHVDKYGPGPNGEGPLANITDWTSSPSLLHKMEKGDGENEAKNEAAYAPKYNVSTPLQYEFAKQMRKEYTEAEGILWQQLRANILGVKFRRQHPIEAYIADFVCLHSALIIEVDGGYHETVEQKVYDDERTRILNEIGFTVLRFSNGEVLQDIENVLEKIKKELTSIESKNEKKNNILESQTNEEQFKTNGFSHPSPRSGEGKGVRETSTMPGYAGSSWYFLRYMDPKNNETFCDRKASDYWNQVDLYIGGTEHAVGHLLYSRMWTKVLFDLGHIGFDEPFRKLLNQGMIQGSSRFVYRVKGKNTFVSYRLKEQYNTDTIHVDVSIVNGVELDVEAFGKWKNDEYANAEFILEDGKYICGVEIEKMSKSKYNTVNPDELCRKYGADTFRMYEMFLGPVEASKPWDTKGIEGVHRFLRKLWRLFNDDLKGKVWTDEKASDAELKILHRTIKKIEEDTEKFSFNTAVSAFMIAVNELADIKCHKKEILEPLLILLVPYAPHITEELYQQLNALQVSPSGEDLEGASILDAAYPKFNPALLVESSKEYPISINGKVRANISLALDLDQQQVEEIILQNETVQKWLEGKAPKKIIYVKNKMINVVL